MPLSLIHDDISETVCKFAAGLCYCATSVILLDTFFLQSLAILSSATQKFTMPGQPFRDDKRIPTTNFPKIEHYFKISEMLMLICM